MMRGIALSLLILLLPQDARGQQSGDPAPVAQVTIDRPRVVVGQRVTMSVVILAPNYLTAPPELPTFQLRNAVTRQLPSINTSEERDGMTYAGVRFEFAIYPQEPGDFVVPGQKARIRYAAEPPKTREIEIGLPSVSFESFVPAGAAALRPFVSADGLSVEQEVKQSSENLKTGDAVTRTVTIRAEGTLAMLLPPQTFAVVEGLRLYPAQPALEDKEDRRSSAVTSTRVDAATYMLQRPGDYSLPAIDIGWWNVGAGRVEQIHLAAVPLTVTADPAGEAVVDGRPATRWHWQTLIDAIANHWLLGALALMLLLALAWIAPAATRWLMATLRRRRAIYRDSEAWSFRKFRAATRQRKAAVVYSELLSWVCRFEPLAPADVDALTSAANDPALKRQIDALQRELFAAGDETTPGWSPRVLKRHVSSARKTLRRRSMHLEIKTALPRQINPVGSRIPEFSKRRVAR